MKYLSLIFLIVISSCLSPEKDKLQGGEIIYSDYPIEPVNIRNVRLTDDFWLPIIKRVQEQTIDFALQKCEEEGRFENFLIAGGQLQGDVRGSMPFDYTDVYKIIEGASNSLISSPNKDLEVLLDSIIAIIKIGQEEDGYLTTWKSISNTKSPAEWCPPGERWENLSCSHELYNAGHLYEAAAVHFKATGKSNFLDIALKNADLLVETFGENKLETVPGHQIVETGLIQLYRITKKEKYLTLAKYFLDQRGNAITHELYGPYNQDHMPVIQQEEAVGHAVRAVYMYAGMTDVATIYRDTAYRIATEKIWDNITDRKLYITGGIGARHQGESFGDDFELPNLTAYNETCAAIGNVYWNHRLFLQSGDVKYYDIIERTLYNGLLAGLSLDGKKFFYPNPLESDGKYNFNQGACTRSTWFDCSCCPSNLIRFMPSMQGLIYSKLENTVFVNLYASNEAKIDLNGENIRIVQKTQYPWSGKINIEIDPSSQITFTLKFRVPGWCRGEVTPGNLYSYLNNEAPISKISLNGIQLDMEIQDGFYVVERAWNSGDNIELEFPMIVNKVIANELVEEDKDKISLEYGPLVYAFEEIDNQTGYDNISISGNEELEVEYVDSLLDGVNILKVKNTVSSYTAIPYYSWSNRGVGKMKVWLDN